MKRILLAGAAIAIAAAAGCGDNAAQCGPGTDNVDGVCTPSASCGSGTRDDGTGTCIPDGTVICTNGTTFDTTTDQCVVDPTVCQDGTVLIHNECQDPTRGIAVDLEEGAEPNGLGLAGLEGNAVAPAGTITLNAIGSNGFVIHGHVTPFQDNDHDGLLDGDLDAYELTVSAPTLIHVTAAGVNGVAAGFEAVAVANRSDLLSAWHRLGVSLSDATSKRELFLPRAGTYLIGIADTRTLFLDGGAVGGPRSEYYVTIDQLAIPTPTVLTATNGVVAHGATISSDETLFFTVPMDLGLNDVELSIPQHSASASAVVLVNTNFRNVADATAQDDGNGGTITGPAQLAVGGLAATDTTTIVVDYDFDYALTDVTYALTVKTRTAVPLAVNGSATQLEVGVVAPGTPAAAANQLLTAYYLDVAAAGQIVGVTMGWHSLVDGYLVDQNGTIVAPFSYDPFDGAFGVNSWVSYKGALRFPAAGRYYVAVYDVGNPNINLGVTTLTVDTVLTTITPTTIALGTPLTAQPLSAIGANLYSYAAGTTAPWQTFDVTPTGSPTTNDAELALYDPATAFGRLDPLTLSTSGPVAGDPTPVFARTYPSTGTDTRIVTGGPATYLVDLESASSTTFGVSFAARAGFTNFGTVMPPATKTATDTIGGAGPAAMPYYLAAPPGSVVTVTVHPTTAFDPEIDQLDADGQPIVIVQAPAVSADATFAFDQDATGYTAIQVTGAPAAGTYTLTIQVAAAPSYAATTGSTAFADACAGGTHVPLSNPDDAIATLAPPAGFQFFGRTPEDIFASTNGYLTFDLPFTDGPDNAPLPAAADPFSIIAPYWADLDGVTICTQTVGSKLVIQWNGHIKGDYTRVIATQAILDPADNSVELVWGATQTALGRDASIGVQDSAGLVGTQVELYTEGAITAGTSKKLTP